jgi:hypothetical protein
MELLRRSAGAVGADSVPGGAVGGARFGVLRLSEGCVPSRDYGGSGGQGSRSRGEGRWGWQGALWSSEERQGVGSLGFRQSGVGGLCVGIKWASSRHRGLSRAMVLDVTKSVGRSLRFSAFLGVRLKFFSGHLIGRGCATQPGSSCLAPGSGACLRRGQSNGGLGCGSSCRDIRYSNGERFYRRWCCGG